MGGDLDRQGSGPLLDELARIGGQAAAVARMTEADVDLDTMESEHGMLQRDSVILKSELHNLSGEEAFSFDQAFDNEQSSADDLENGPTASNEFVLAFVTFNGKLSIHPGTKGILHNRQTHDGEAQNFANHIVTLVNYADPFSISPDNMVDFSSFIESFSGTSTVDETSTAASYLSDKAVATLRGRWSSEVSGDGEDRDATILLLYVKLEHENNPEVKCGEHALASREAVQQIVLKLYALAALLSTSMMLLCREEGDLDESSGIKEFLAPLSSSCQKYRDHIQEQISSCRVSGADLMWMYFRNISDEEQKLIDVTKKKALSAAQIVNNSDASSYFGCPEESVFCADDLSHSRALLKTPKQKISPTSGTSSDQMHDLASIVMEMAHLSAQAIELFDESSEDEHDIADSEGDDESKEPAEYVSNTEENIRINEDGGGGHEHLVAPRSRDEGSRRHCTEVLSELLIEHNIITGGSFEEKLFSDEFLKTEKKLELEHLSDILQAYFIRAHGAAVQDVLTRFFAIYLCHTPPLAIQTSREQAAVQSLQQSQKMNRELKARVEALSTENSELQEALEEKTDKALDAWAVAQEKYNGLEEITRGMHEQMGEQEELIVTLKRRVAELEKLNAAMKKGVMRMIEEEEGTSSANGRSNRAAAREEGTGLTDYLSFALSCATGAPYDEESNRNKSEIQWKPAMGNHVRNKTDSTPPKPKS